MLIDENKKIKTLSAVMQGAIRCLRRKVDAGVGVQGRCEWISYRDEDQFVNWFLC